MGGNKQRAEKTWAHFQKSSCVTSNPLALFPFSSEKNVHLTVEKKRTSKQASKGVEIEALHHKFFTQWGGWGRRHEGTQMLKMKAPPLTKTLGFSGKHAKIRGGAPIRVGSEPFL